MSKYVKEMIRDQLKNELGENRSLLIMDFNGLDAVSEHKLRMDLRKKKIQIRVLRNNLARLVFAEAGLDGLNKYLSGPSVAVWGGEGVAELAKEVSTKVKALKKPAIKGGVVDGTVIGPEQVEDITKLPSREALIGRIVSLALAPAQRIVSLANAPAAGLQAQLKTLAEGAPASEAESETAPAPETEGEPPPVES